MWVIDKSVFRTQSKLAVFAKNSITDACLASEYASDLAINSMIKTK